MRCPKCGYLGFEEVDRCRNCGYEFSLAAAPTAPDFALRDQNASEVASIGDLRIQVEPESRTPSVSADDLPLFGVSMADDAPMITRVSPPRQPLAVRRATPDVPRSRVELRAQTFDLAFEPETAMSSRRLNRLNRASSTVGDAGAGAASNIAGLGARFFAVLLDLLILGAVDTLVVYLTLQICGLRLAELAMLPKGPLLAYILVQNGGYFVVFTAGGQTLGKMAAGIRVVAADDNDTVDLGRAMRRTLVWLALAIPVGLGFLTALLTHDRRGLHDRFAGTRVVRASV